MGMISTAEAAKRWGVSERSVRNYCAQGRVPGAVMVGKTWSIPDVATKPQRSNARNPESALLQRLREERELSMPGGIYHRVQIELTYNSNHIEGSRLTRDETRLIFETSTIRADSPRNVNDIIETVNHFRCIDYIIDHAQDPISQDMVKELHRMLKTSTRDAGAEWFAVGAYKRLPNEVGGRMTTAPEDVEREMDELIRTYEDLANASMRDVVAFHAQFERVHPFQDGNGRVGRLLMFKECLRWGIVPFIITDELKFYYYRGLSEWSEEEGFLMDTCLAAQDAFKRALDRFGIPW